MRVAPLTTEDEAILEDRTNMRAPASGVLYNWVPLRESYQFADQCMDGPIFDWAANPVRPEGPIERRLLLAGMGMSVAEFAELQGLT